MARGKHESREEEDREEREEHARGGAIRQARKEGGKVLEYTKESNVMDEAEDKKRKAGGRVTRAAGGRVKLKAGGASEGMKSAMRLDRPGRKRGGGVGADMTPLTTAAKTTEAGAHKADNDELAH